jgi:hypothetical protein
MKKFLSTAVAASLVMGFIAIGSFAEEKKDANNVQKNPASQPAVIKQMDANSPMDSNQPPRTPKARAAWQDRVKQTRISELQAQITYEQTRYDERTKQIQKIIETAVSENATQTAEQLKKLLAIEGKLWETRKQAMEQRKEQIEKFGVRPGGIQSDANNIAKPLLKQESNEKK